MDDIRKKEEYISLPPYNRPAHDFRVLRGWNSGTELREACGLAAVNARRPECGDVNGN